MKIAKIHTPLLLSISIIGLLLLSSCSKERFKLFDDRDCVTTTELIKIELPITEIPGKGGYIKLTPSVYTEVTYYQHNEVLKVENLPIEDYSVAIVDAPLGTTIQRSDEGIVLNIPENPTFGDLSIVISITADGVTKRFTLKQKRLKFKVDVDIA